MDEVVAEFRMGNLAADEFDYQSDFVTLLEEIGGFVEPDIKVVGGNKRGEADFFNVLTAAALFTTGGLLLELIFELGKINDFGYRRVDIRGDFYQIQTGCLGSSQGFFFS